MTGQKRIVVAITGASGAIYGIRALELLRGEENVETHLILSPSGAQTIALETDLSLKDVRALADQTHAFKNIGASLSSGSFRVDGMVVAPCSIKTLSGIANSYDENLIIRTADVCLKERRPLALMVRETPLHQGHLELMARAASYGAFIAPPVPAFYHRPASIDAIVNQTVGRTLDLLGLDLAAVHRWKDSEEDANRAV